MHPVETLHELVEVLVLLLGDVLVPSIVVELDDLVPPLIGLFLLLGGLDEVSKFWLFLLLSDLDDDSHDDILKGVPSLLLTGFL